MHAVDCMHTVAHHLQLCVMPADMYARKLAAAADAWQLLQQGGSGSPSHKLDCPRFDVHQPSYVHHMSKV
jgi:hypothetical protein